MLDKVDIRIPAATPFSPKMAEIYAYAAHPDVNLFHESDHYTRTGDLRPFGMQSRIHVGLKHGKATSGVVPVGNGRTQNVRLSPANHKLELIDVGEMGFSRMVHEVGEVFGLKQSKILALETIRVDLAADVVGVPVTWFRDNVRAQYKRWGAELGEYTEMGSKGVETVYFGKRPNCFRIYDKVAELKYQHKRLTRKASPDADKPDFQETWGVPETDFIMTRVERQIGGGRIPTELSNIARLKNAPDFNPFGKLKFRAAGAVVPNQGTDDNTTYWAGLYLRQMFLEAGQHNFHRYMSGKCGDNLIRTMKRFARYLPAIAAGGVTAANLYDFYRNSVTRQLAD